MTAALLGLTLLSQIMPSTSMQYSPNAQRLSVHRYDIDHAESLRSKASGDRRNLGDALAVCFGRRAGRRHCHDRRIVRSPERADARLIGTA
jgi:hypothetical protein